jgi:hypothetical protein
MHGGGGCAPRLLQRHRPVVGQSAVPVGCAHRQQDYTWWAARLRKIFEMVDIVRIDHFRGFAGYWEIPGDAETAIDGKWVPGPGPTCSTPCAAIWGR